MALSPHVGFDKQAGVLLPCKRTCSRAHTCNHSCRVCADTVFARAHTCNHTRASSLPALSRRISRNVPVVGHPGRGRNVRCFMRERSTLLSADAPYRSSFLCKTSKRAWRVTVKRWWRRAATADDTLPPSALPPTHSRWHALNCSDISQDCQLDGMTAPTCFKVLAHAILRCRVGQLGRELGAPRGSVGTESVVGRVCSPPGTECMDASREALGIQ